MSKTVLITGSTSGVGKELCFFYEKKGWEVWALGRDKNKLKNQQTVTTYIIQFKLPLGRH